MLKANRSGDETRDLRQKTLLYCHIIQKKKHILWVFFPLISLIPVEHRHKTSVVPLIPLSISQP